MVNKNNKKAQWKIQQMAFMILAVFFFFILVGLFFLGWYMSDFQSRKESLLKQEAIASIEVISNMPELNCDSREEFCVDEDKLRIFSGNFARNYDNFWPVSSVRVYKVHPSFDSVVKCPAPNCNYYEIFDSGQENKVEYSGYVSICKKVREGNYVYDKCDIGKLLVGVVRHD